MNFKYILKNFMYINCTKTFTYIMVLHTRCINLNNRTELRWGIGWNKVLRIETTSPLKQWHILHDWFHHEWYSVYIVNATIRKLKVFSIFCNMTANTWGSSRLCSLSGFRSWCASLSSTCLWGLWCCTRLLWAEFTSPGVCPSDLYFFLVSKTT